MQNNWYRKEKPLLSMMGMGGGNAARLTAGGLAPLEITGASVTSYSDSTHTWIVQTASNPITVSRGFDAVDEVEILLVGGGGAGSSGLSGASGGGGAGGVVVVPKTKGPEIITAPGTYPITVGAGGPYSPPASGGNTQIASVAIPLLARGGGRGGQNFDNPGLTGGSGGGGAASANGGPGSQPTENPGVSGINQYGNPGRRGNAPTEPYQGGGGGGAGQGGPITTVVRGGADGIPISPLLPGFMTPSFPAPIINALGAIPNSSPEYDYFGGGAGGGARAGGLSPFGLGGGGQGGGVPPAQPGTAGKNGRGGGGGGGAENGGQAPGAAGGSGCFILRFKQL